jgi:uncharacterized protein
MKFKINAVKHGSDGEMKTFYYDNIENILSAEDGLVYENPNVIFSNLKEYTSFSPTNPLKKSNSISILKIQLGLSCNFECEYCSQRFVERADETSKDDIAHFMSKLENLSFDEKTGLRIELWGGEPLVYWKTIVPLVKELKNKFKNWSNPPKFFMISNGSLLTEEINQWILYNLDSIAISHDGPGQFVRGPDPFEDPEVKRLALELYRKFRGNMSFNAMINAQNMSRKAVYEWFKDFTGNPEVRLGEGAFVDAYDEGGMTLSLKTKADHFKFRQLSFKEIIENNANLGFGSIKDKLDYFNTAVTGHKHAKYLGQKCGMDDDNTLAIDLHGNVLTCQNVSAVAINSNGEPHKAGNIEDMNAVQLTSSTHWTQRKECSNCPVLHICKGSCMFVSGDFWYQTCANAYSDAIPIFAMTIYNITGYIPVFIDADILPDERKDIFGTILTHKENTKKPFPIKIVAG